MILKDTLGRPQEYLLLVVRSHGNSFVNRHKNIRLYQFALPEDPHSRAVSIQKCSMLGKLLQLDFGHGHESVDFVFRPLEVFDTERVYCDDFHSRLVAYFKNLL